MLYYSIVCQLISYCNSLDTCSKDCSRRHLVKASMPNEMQHMLVTPYADFNVQF